MKIKRLAALIGALFRPGVANTTSLSGNIIKAPAGMVPDAFALYGLLAMVPNLDALDPDLVAVPIGTQTAVTLTAAQFCAFVSDISGSPGTGVTLTTPTAAQIIALLNAYNTIPGDGFNFVWVCMNDATGQTITLAAGTGVTINGKTNTVATDTSRLFIVNVNINAGTVTMVNVGGGWTL